MHSCHTIWIIHSFLSFLRVTKFELILELAWNTTRMNVASPMVDILLRGKLFENSLDSKFSLDEKQEVC